MSTAQALYRIYKDLPERERRKFKRFLDNEEVVEVSMSALSESIEQVKLLKQGKAKTRPLSELITELKNG